MYIPSLKNGCWNAVRQQLEERYLGAHPNMDWLEAMVSRVSPRETLTQSPHDSEAGSPRLILELIKNPILVS